MAAPAAGAGVRPAAGLCREGEEGDGACGEGGRGNRRRLPQQQRPGTVFGRSAGPAKAACQTPPPQRSTEVAGCAQAQADVRVCAGWPLKENSVHATKTVASGLPFI